MQGECVIVHSKDWEADDMAEISARLKSVSPGAACQEFSLRSVKILLRSVSPGAACQEFSLRSVQILLRSVSPGAASQEF